MSIKQLTGRLAVSSIYMQGYSFDIEHRKSSDHGNLDALSRPVLNIQVIRDGVYEESSEKQLDLWDNFELMHILQYGRHENGASKNQI